MATDGSKGTSDAAGRGIRLIWWLVDINLGLVALPGIVGRFFMSGSAAALTVHEIGAVALKFGAPGHRGRPWRRLRVPVADLSIGLFVTVFFRWGSATGSRTGCM